MKISIITLFPEIFPPILNHSIIGRAQKKDLVEFKLINLRDFGEGVHKVVDGRPYGGGAGMLLRADILKRALNFAKTSYKASKPKVILMSASGYPYTQQKARQLSKLNELIIVCGHYEGVDQRFIDKFVDEEISIGDYVVTGGEVPAMIVTDSIVRLIEGVLEKEDATLEESYEKNLLEYPHFTRPSEFEGEKVPEILVSGNHEAVAKWREEESTRKTRKFRPDLLKKP